MVRGMVEGSQVRVHRDLQEGWKEVNPRRAWRDRLQVLEDRSRESGREGCCPDSWE